MKKETKTIAQQLNVVKLPFSIKNNNGQVIYFEESNGFWHRCEFDSNGNTIYFEDKEGFWNKNEYNSNNKLIYLEDSNGYWLKREYDDNGNQIYFEDSDGVIKDDRPKVMELSIQEIANKLGIDAKFLKIVDK